MVAEIIALADDNALDIGRSRRVEQEVLDVLDRPTLGVETPEALAHIAEAIEKSRYILSLPPNWDGEGSPAYDATVWERACRFLLHNAAKLWRQQGVRAAAPAIHNGPQGSVDIHWKIGSRQLLFNVPADADRAATYYGTNPDTGIETKGSLDTSASNEWLLMWITAQ
jgi:hypothetical protein